MTSIRKIRLAGLVCKFGFQVRIVCFLKKNRQTFSNGTVSSKCRHCHLEEEDLLHLVSRCPAFYRIRIDTISSLKDKLSVTQLFCDWTFVMKTLVCAESVVIVLSDLKNARDATEKLSRDFFFKIHLQKLQLENQRG